jgi:1,4-dihydroxy-2-naphthoate octaprenyltransferase
VKNWVAAFRLKTLPLALGAIIVGSSLNSFAFDAEVFIFASLTAIFLQILSNLANDYGDFVKGTDKHRKDRALGSGKISKKSMKVAVFVFIILSLISGIYLLTIAFGDNIGLWIKFFILGLLCIGAAIAYTVGKKAYGYNALGDVFVFIFFGLVGVMGTAYLYSQNTDASYFFAALGYGSLCVAVININNIRDIEKDVLTNKTTVASKLGKEGAIYYQAVLMLLAIIGFAGHHLVSNYFSLAPVGAMLLGFVHFKRLKEAESIEQYNAQLKFVSLSSLATAILFAFEMYV